MTKTVYVRQATLSVRTCAPVITATTKCLLMKRMMMRAIINAVVNTVTDLILNTDSCPFFFDIDAIFFIQDIWERYFLAFLKVSSFLVFLILMPQIWRVINLENRNELG